MTPTTILLINYLYVTAISLKSQTSYYISGHHCTVTMRSVHLQVKDQGVRLTKGNYADFVCASVQ